LSTTEGLHVPFTPLAEVVGRTGALVPAQMDRDVPKLNTGVTTGLTVTVNVVVAAHCPAAGVKVYVAEFWLSMTDGLHVPVMPFNDEPASVGTVPPGQIESDVPKLNVGVINGLTETVNDVVVAH
jgi:hypothetical protein